MEVSGCHLTDSIIITAIMDIMDMTVIKAIVDIRDIIVIKVTGDIMNITTFSPSLIKMVKAIRNITKIKPRLS
jgi:hypothetical protein